MGPASEQTLEQTYPLYPFGRDHRAAVSVLNIPYPLILLPYTLAIANIRAEFYFYFLFLASEVTKVPV